MERIFKPILLRRSLITKAAVIQILKLKHLIKVVKISVQKSNEQIYLIPKIVLQIGTKER